MADRDGESREIVPEKKWVLDWELMEEPESGGGILPQIDREYFFGLLMEEQEQM